MTKYDEYSEVYKRNAERMAILKALCEAAKKCGDKETSRKYRAEYTDLKAEIDAKAFGVIAETN